MLAARSAGAAIRPRALLAGHVWHHGEDAVGHVHPVAESSRRAGRPRHLSTAPPALAPRKAPSAETTDDPNTPSSAQSTSLTEFESEKVAVANEAQVAGKKRQKAFNKAQQFARSLRKASFAGTQQSAASAAPLYFPPSPGQGGEHSMQGTAEDQLASILADSPVGKWTVYDKRYREAHKKAYQRIDSSFLVGQLKKVSKVAGSHRLNKPILIQTILLNNGWPVPLDRPKPEPEGPVETVTKTLDLPENQLFLFLRDTRTLEELMLNRGVTFAVVPASTAEDETRTDRTVLQAEGTAQALNKLQRLLQGRAGNMTVTTVSGKDLRGFRPSLALMRFLSNATGAFIEPFGDDGYRISTMNPAKAAAAERMLHVAATRSASHPAYHSTSILSPSKSTDPDQTEYDLFSLLPSFSTPSMVLPWHTISNNQSLLQYRFRRVNSWAAKAGKRELVHRDEELEWAEVVPLGPQGEPLNLEKLYESLSAGVPTDTGKRISTVVFGHLLSHNTDPSPLAALTSPIPGQWPLADSRQRFSTAQSQLFAPALTPSMIHFSLANPPQNKRRLTYRSLDGKSTATFTYSYPLPQDPEDIDGDVIAGQESENWMAKLEQMVKEMEQLAHEKENKAKTEAGEQSKTGVKDEAKTSSDKSVSDEGAEAASEQTGSGEPANVVIEGELSYVSETDLMMPDRPVDGRLSVRSSSTIPIPEQVDAYFEALLAPPPEGEKEKTKVTPLPPISITLNGEKTFTLETDEEVEVKESYTPGDNVVLRSVRTKDMVLGVDRITAHTELVHQGESLPVRFWRELANVSRDVSPDAGSLRSAAGRSLFL